MEFVRIGRLKETLVAGPLSARETAKYLAVQGALLSALYLPSAAEGPPAWSYVAYPVSVLAGVYYCYRQNGGATGIRFAERYLAIGWVVTVRIALFVLLPAFVGAFVLTFVVAFAGGDVDRLYPDWFDDGFSVAGLVSAYFIYWRTGTHLAAVHRGQH